MSQKCIIVGAGQASAQLASSLRQEGWEGRIVVITDEGYIPYQRPPLSKTYLSGEQKLDEIYIRPAAVYEKNKIEFVLNTRVNAIDPTGKQISMSNGESMSYDKLALAVGSRVRKVNLPGSDLANVYYLRTVEDAEQIKAKIIAGRKAVIIGGGYIGLETAAVLNKGGMQVTVIEMMDRILKRVTAPEVSEFYTRIHTEHGVEIVCNIGVSAFEGENGIIKKVICNDNCSYEADLVIIGVGIIPNVELAEAADLEVNNGIVVDEYTRTSDPDIVAAGDCTYHPNQLYGKSLRLESVQNATEQARAASATICGNEKPYNALPWFWSDQYDLKLQIAGLAQEYNETIIRGDRENSRSFAAFYLQDGIVVAVDAVNKPSEFMMGKRLITQRAIVDKKKLVDQNVAMKELL